MPETYGLNISVNGCVVCFLFHSVSTYVVTYAELHDFLSNEISNMTRVGGPIADNGSKSISER